MQVLNFLARFMHKSVLPTAVGPATIRRILLFIDKIEPNLFDFYGVKIKKFKVMKNKKVLIVDDNALNRKVFENIIGHSYFFDVAVNGLEAIEKIKCEHFDVILMDIQMPKLDGISTLKIIKEDNLTTSPIIAISAYSSQSDRDCFLATGFDEFMAKPVKPKDLLESVYHHLNKPTIQDEAKETQTTYSDFDESMIEKLRKYNSMDNIKTVYLDFLEEAEGLI
jgi:CheY-like chemotaxis protein